MQFNLLMIALICVPWMLLVKPILLWMKMPKHPEESPYTPNELDEHLVNEDNEEDLPPAKAPPAPAASHSHDEHEDISEIAVHQIIETI